MKPLTLEEAKANIGKEVVYIGNVEQIKNYFSNGGIVIENAFQYQDGDCFVEVKIGACITCRIALKHIALKQTLKIGDTVKLDPSTKPYTIINWSGELVEKRYFHEDSEEHTITAIHADGDILIDNMGYIQPRHLIKVEKKNMTADQLIKRNTVEDATHIGIKSKLFSIFSYETRFLWVNGQWIECGYINDDFEPVTIGIDTGDGESKSAEVEHKPQYTPKEVELRERIAFKLIDHRDFSHEELNDLFKSITGK